MPSTRWFEQLFGTPEASYAETRSRFAVEGANLRSLANGRAFAIGTFSTPTLASLRGRTQEAANQGLRTPKASEHVEAAKDGGRPGRLRVTHEAVGDVLELHARPENRGALFQVASQFNCLEFADPQALPEDGVTDYATDPTQGPACSLAAAGATVYRNYFAPVGGIAGQTRDRQLDNLDELAAVLGDPGAYWEVRNGYTWSDERRLARLREVLEGHDRNELLDAVKIGLQTDVGVTFARRFVEPTTPTVVSQAFCSALSCGYTDIGLDHWEPLATLVLDAAYEATLHAAVLDAAQGQGSGRVWLTFLGGGAFGNRMEWIARAIGRALALFDGVDLDVHIAHYRAIRGDVQHEVEREHALALAELRLGEPL
jgi:hypothetical protein